MKILLTNDDGVHAEGLLALAKYLEKNHDVWVVAPDRNRSGVSHGITMGEPLKICQLSEKRFSCSGVPVDCTFNGINGILQENPDVIISGINKGPNLGTDIVFSGTAAAARQASFYGIPGIAVSLASFEEPLDYSALADFVSKNIEKLVTLCEKDIFLNINADSLSSYKGYKFTSLSKRSYKDKVSVYNAPDGKLYSFFVGGGVESFGDEDSDEKAVSEGYVSISRVLSQPVYKNRFTNAGEFMSDNLRQGIKLYQSRKYTEALSFFLALPPESSDNIDLAYFIGLCYARLNKYDEALLYLEQVVTNGTDAERIKQCRLSLAVIYSLTNRSKMAEFELSKLVDDGLNTEQVQCAQGYVAWYRDEIEKSIECYENVLEQNPENSTALNGLGYILACTGKDLTRALFLCKKALDSNPESSAYLDSLGWVYYKLGLLKEAKSFIKRALEKNPENEEIKEHYQQILSSSTEIKNNDVPRWGQF